MRFSSQHPWGTKFVITHNPPDSNWMAPAMLPPWQLLLVAVAQSTSCKQRYKIITGKNTNTPNNTQCISPRNLPWTNKNAFVSGWLTSHRVAFLRISRSDHSNNKFLKRQFQKEHPHNSHYKYPQRMPTETPTEHPHRTHTFPHKTPPPFQTNTQTKFHINSNRNPNGYTNIHFTQQGTTP